MSDAPHVQSQNAHVIITIHGIRTYGRWQARLRALLLADVRWSANAGQSHILSYRYGVFTLPSFLVPFLRNRAATQLRRYLEAVHEAHPQATIDIVAHSFGTFLVLEALASEQLPPGFSIRNAIFCGSAARPNHDLSRLVGHGRRISRLVNDCGTRDGVLLLTFFVVGVGMAGRIGFQGFEGYTVWNRYHLLGHSGYFETTKKHASYDGFMRRWWLPILLSEAVVLERDRRPITPTLSDRLVRVLGENGSRVTVAIYIGLLSLAAAPPLYFWKEKVKAEFQVAQIERGRATLQAAAQARRAATALREDDRGTAVMLALEALVHQDKHAFIPEAYKVLYEAAYVIDTKERILDLEGTESTWTFSPSEGEAVTLTKGGNINVWSAESGIVFRKSTGSVVGQASASPSGDAIFMDGALGPGLFRYRSRERQLDEVSLLSAGKRPYQFVALSSQTVAACDFGKSLYELKMAPNGNDSAATTWDLQLPTEGDCTVLAKGGDDQLIVGTNRGEIVWVDTIRRVVVKSRKVSDTKFNQIHGLYTVKDVVIASLFGRYAVFKGERKEADFEVDGGIGYERPFVTPDGLTMVAMDTRVTMKPLLLSTNLNDKSTKQVECPLCKIVSVPADDRLVLWRGEQFSLEEWEPKSLQRKNDLLNLGRDVDRLEYVPSQSSVIAYRSGHPAVLRPLTAVRFANTFSNVRDDRNKVTNIAFIDQGAIAVGLVRSSSSAVSALGAVTIEWTGETWKLVGDVPFVGGQWIHVLPFEFGSVGLFSPTSFFNAELGIFSPGSLKVLDKKNQSLGDVDSTTFPLVDQSSGFAVIKAEDGFRAFDLRRQKWTDLEAGKTRDDLPWDFRNGRLVWSDDSNIFVTSVGSHLPPVKIKISDGLARQVCLDRNGRNISALIESTASSGSPAVFLRNFSISTTAVVASVQLDLENEEIAKAYEELDAGLSTNPDGVRWATRCEDDFMKLSTESGEKRLLWNKKIQTVVVEDTASFRSEQPSESQRYIIHQQGERIFVSEKVSGRQIFETPKLKSAPSTFTVSRAEEWVAVGTEDGILRLWLLSDPSSPCIELKAHNSKIQTLLFNPDDTWLASVGDDGSIRAWPTPSAEGLAKLFQKNAMDRPSTSR